MVTLLAAGMPLKNAMKLVKTVLTEAGCPEADADARELVRLAAGRDPLLSENTLSTAQAEVLQSITIRRASREPLQYIEGHWAFLDFELEVGPGVLCPRSDTEVVCECAAQTLRGIEKPQVLDLCAGTGCIGLGIRRLCPGAEVTALEKSPEALKYLYRNAENSLTAFGVEGPAVQVIRGDVFLFQEMLAPESADLIVSNPPYLTESEMRRLQPEVAREPAMALDGGVDGGNFYRHIAKAYGFALKQGGWLVLEIGCGQQELLRRILCECGWAGRPVCRQDYGGNDRVILVQRVR